MGNTPKRRNGAHPQPGPGEGTAALPAIVPDRTVPGAVEHARQVTHDELIRRLGPRRRSGVWWVQRPGASGARLYAELAAQGGREVEDEVREVLDNPRVLVVCAFANATGPAGPGRGGWFGGKS